MYRGRPIFIPSIVVKILFSRKLYILSFLRNTTLIEYSFASVVTPRNNEVLYLMLLLTKMLHYFTRIRSYGRFGHLSTSTFIVYCRRGV